MDERRFACSPHDVKHCSLAIQKDIEVTVCSSDSLFASFCSQVSPVDQLLILPCVCMVSATSASTSSRRSSTNAVQCRWHVALPLDVISVSLYMFTERLCVELQHQNLASSLRTLFCVRGTGGLSTFDPSCHCHQPLHSSPSVASQFSHA